MKIKVTANNTNGNQPGQVEWFECIDRAKMHADWWHGQSALCNVEIKQPLGVQLTLSNGTKIFEEAAHIDEANEAVKSWQGVIANKKINRTRVRQAEVVGLRFMTSKATEEDKLVGAWMAAALEDPLVSPVMKYDINLWLDSKEWV
jgi:hypothetical protein